MPTRGILSVGQLPQRCCRAWTCVCWWSRSVRRSNRSRLILCGHSASLSFDHARPRRGKQQRPSNFGLEALCSPLRSWPHSSCNFTLARLLLTCPRQQHQTILTAIRASITYAQKTGTAGPSPMMLRLRTLVAMAIAVGGASAFLLPASGPQRTMIKAKVKSFQSRGKLPRRVCC